MREVRKAWRKDVPSWRCFAREYWEIQWPQRCLFRWGGENYIAPTRTPAEEKVGAEEFSWVTTGAPLAAFAAGAEAEGTASSSDAMGASGAEQEVENQSISSLPRLPVF